MKTYISRKEFAQVKGKVKVEKIFGPSRNKWDDENKKYLKLQRNKKSDLLDYLTFVDGEAVKTPSEFKEGDLDSSWKKEYQLEFSIKEQEISSYKGTNSVSLVSVSFTAPQVADMILEATGFDNPAPTGEDGKALFGWEEARISDLANREFKFKKEERTYEEHIYFHYTWKDVTPEQGDEEDLFEEKESIDDFDF